MSFIINLKAVRPTVSIGRHKSYDCDMYSIWDGVNVKYCRRESQRQSRD